MCMNNINDGFGNNQKTCIIKSCTFKNQTFSSIEKSSFIIIDIVESNQFIIAFVKSIPSSSSSSS